MKKHTLYIGANNDTGLVEVGKAVEVAGRYFDGFTVLEAVGYWEGKPEKSVTMPIFTTDTARVRALARDLCGELQQQAVLVEMPDGEGEMVRA